MALFVRLTVTVAVAIVAIVALFFVLKIIVVAAIVAGIAIGAAWLFSRLRRRFGSARVTTLTARR